MSDDAPLPSLLAEADRQGALFSMPATYEEKLAVTGQYTAERLFSHDPEKYKAVVAMLAAGRGIRAIKRACTVHHDTIHAVAKRERIAIDTLKQRIITDLETAVQVGAERVVDVIESMDGDKLPLALAVLIDKLQLLTGGATMRVESNDITPTTKEPADFDGWLAGLKSANGPKMGLGEGGKVQIGAGSEPPAVHRLAPPAELPILADQASRDAESVAHQKQPAEATAQATEAERIAGGQESADQGEGGVAKPGGEPASPTHSRLRNFDAIGAPSPATPAGSAGADTESTP